MDLKLDFLAELTEDQIVSLQQLRERVQPYLCPYVDNHRIFRFLKAKRYDVDKAEKAVIEHLQFREKFGLDTIHLDFKPKEVVEKYFPERFLGFDKEGNAVMGCLLGLTDIKGLICSTTKTDHLKTFLYHHEKIGRALQEESKKRGNDGRRNLLIFDLNQLSLRHLMDRKFGQIVLFLSKMYCQNFPGMIKRVFVLNAPSFFLPWFNVVKAFLPVELKGISIYGREGWKEDLLDIIDADVLPAIFGGSKMDPDGNPDCWAVFPEEKKIPTSYYLKNKNTQFIEDPFTKFTVVRERTYYNQEVYVQKVNSVLSWTFQTIHYNIGFGIYYVPNGVKPMSKVSMPKFSKSFRHRVRRNSKDGHDIIIPPERAESHLFPEEGEMVCEKAGLYLIHFDNSFSWNTPKKLYYKIEVKPPKKDVTNIEVPEISYDSALD